MKESNSYRQILLGGGTAAGIIIFLAIIAGIQFITVRNPKRWDLTKIGEHTLAPQSTQVVQTFKDRNLPVHVLGFYETRSTAAMEAARDLLDRYRDVDANFTYSFIDPDIERATAHKYKIDSYPTLVLKAGDREERIENATEENITNALGRLLKTEVKKVYFLKGHGELSPNSPEQDGMSVAREHIEKQNYKTAELVLLQTPDVPEDATVLVIAGAKMDPLESEFEAIRRFLDRGGSLMVLLNPFETPKLTELLTTFGFETKNDIVVDRMSRALGGDYLMPVITQYNEFPITKGFRLASFFPEVRSVRVPKKPVPRVVAEELALSSPFSWTISEDQLKSGNANFDPQKGEKGPIPVMAVATYTNYSSLNTSEESKGEESPDRAEAKESGSQRASDESPKTAEKPRSVPVKARIATFGSAQIAANKFYNLSGNRDLFMNTVSWLAADENLIAIRPKERWGQPLVLTVGESWAVMLIPVVLAPLAWIVAGLIVYVYRRRTATA
jgi:ABC-type uncharacterized transport system involved in gliding motility auxiliary subunit